VKFINPFTCCGNEVANLWRRRKTSSASERLRPWNPTSYRIVFREVEMHAVCNDYIAVAHKVQFFSMWAFLFTYVTAVKDWTSEEDALLLQRKRIVVSMDGRSLSWAISLTNYFS